jgi:hypothetical protein
VVVQPQQTSCLGCPPLHQTIELLFVQSLRRYFPVLISAGTVFASAFSGS